MNACAVKIEMNQRRYDTLIVGLGKTGLSCVRHFRRQGRQSIAVLDSRSKPPELARLQQRHSDVPVYLGDMDTDLLCRAHEIILSPGVAVSEPAIQRALAMGVAVYGDVELFSRQVTRPVIAVTGSNGKSTVVTLVSEMIRTAGLKAEPGGNIGTPVLDLLALDAPDFYVLELSSFQLETVRSLNAVAAVILNVSEDHMDRYADLAAYIKAKQNIYQGEGVIVLNRDEQKKLAAQDMQDRHCISYGTDRAPANMFGLQGFAEECWLMQGEQRLLPISKLKIPGRHNLSNALAALALGASVKLPVDAMLHALGRFQGLPHRCQFIASFQGVSWYNDSKATNVGASCAAIAAFSPVGRIILIAGGAGKGADFSPLAVSVRHKVCCVIVMGEEAVRLEVALAGLVPVYFALSMEVAVSTAAELAQTGDIVLLSPACASVDMFTDYQARGEAYIQAVHMLLPGGGD